MDCSPPGFSVHGIFQGRILIFALCPISTTLTFFKLFFLIEVWFVYNVVLVSNVQQNDSFIYKMSICTYTYSFQIPFPYRLLQNIECNSLCYTVGPCWVSILYVVVCKY